MLIPRLLPLVTTVFLAGNLTPVPTSVDSNSSRAIAASARQAENSSATADAIRKVREEWAKRLREKQLEPLVDLYAPGGVFLIPTGERFAGRDAIRELCRNTMAVMTSDITLRSLVTESSGSLAYDSGQFEERLIRVSDGKKFESHGSYLMVFKRQPEGPWLIAEQVWTGVEPPGLGQAGR
jgi:ketosteroid isomerase-like protein